VLWNRQGMKLFRGLFLLAFQNPHDGKDPTIKTDRLGRKYRVVSVMAMFRQLCRCRGQLKTCFSSGGHLEYYLSQADSWGISSGGTHNVLGGRTLYE
jgi:hypothetical protein